MPSRRSTEDGPALAGNAVHRSVPGVRKVLTAMRTVNRLGRRSSSSWVTALATASVLVQFGLVGAPAGAMGAPAAPSAQRQLSSDRLSVAQALVAARSSGRA